MSTAKKILKSKNVIAWAVTTTALTALLVTLNVLGTGRLNKLFCNLAGGPRAVVDTSNPVKLYEKDCASKEDAYKAANNLTKEICEEGMVLLKNENNALPLKANAKVSVFGKNSVNIVRGGSGSAAPTTEQSDLKTIFDSLTEVGIEYNPTLRSFYENNSLSGEGRTVQKSNDFNGSKILKTGETPIEKYTSNSIPSSYDEYSDAALVVLSRIAGENWDLPRTASDDSSRHYLELDNNERALLKHIADSNKFKHIIILINSSNNIDLGFLKYTDDPAYDSKIDGALLIGSTGANGIMALGSILSGKVNPSGRTVDTMYTKYQNDPTWQNFGDNNRTNGDAYYVGDTPQSYYFVDYEESIYVGYRYYETRGNVEGEAWYDKNVVYPFGHGLSYTSFIQEIVGKSNLESAKLAKDKSFKVSVKVTNTGEVAGKEVVQIYATAPYTNGGIEKSHKVLVGYGKTSEIAPGKSDTVDVTINPYYLASFDAEDKNGNGFKGYELEKGNYIFTVGKNAHSGFETFTKTLDADQRYDKDPTTGYDVKNLFDFADDHLQEDLTRSNFEGTFPKTPTMENQTVTSEFIQAEKNYTHDNPEDLSQMPITGAQYEEVIKLKDLSGLPYNDPLWDKFLDQLTFEEMLNFFNGGSYSTEKIERVGVPQTIACDGPTGIVAFMGDAAVYGTCYYMSECLLAQTYNDDLAKEFGKSVGEECLWGDQRKDGTHLPYTGWYATGVNIHRSPFSGRNTEYYSEDPLISGKMAASVVLASQEKGVYTNIKHFALNDQETHRGTNGVNTWCKEQAIREIYLKPFEIAVKEGKTLGLMSSFNRIGQKWAGGSYVLLTEVLRHEWGFEGSVICDFHTDDYMNNRQMIYAGGDLNLTTTKQWSKASADSPEDVNVLRRAIHNNLYAIANSNAIQFEILGYKLPKWQIGMYAGTGGVGGVLLAWGVLAVILALKKKPV